MCERVEKLFVGELDRRVRVEQVHVRIGVVEICIRYLVGQEAYHNLIAYKQYQFPVLVDVYFSTREQEVVGANAFHDYLHSQVSEVNVLTPDSLHVS